MNISLLGQAPHLQWFADRLTKHGFVLAAGQIPSCVQSARLGHDWHSGLQIGSLLIDTGPTPLHDRVARAQACRQAGLEYAELAGHWLAPGVEYGFPLFVGAGGVARGALQPLLDALAPRAGAWLFCGPPGAACYAAQTFDALSASLALAMQAGWARPGEAPTPPDWPAFFRQQQELSVRLLEWAQHYLTLNPDEAASDPWAQLARFQQPPALQAHFAANLARLIVLAFGQGLAVQEILQALLPA